MCRNFQKSKVSFQHHSIPYQCSIVTKPAQSKYLVAFRLNFHFSLRPTKDQMQLAR